jgi:methyl-accepting chemotaxis protein
MNSILLFGLIVVIIFILVIIGCYIYFRHSIITSISLIITNMAGLCSFLSFVIATEGFKTLTWALPVVILLTGINYLIMIRNYSKPLQLLKKEISEKLSKGNLNFQFDNSLLIKKNEYGDIAQSLENMRYELFKIVNEVNEISSKIRISAEQQSQTAVYISSGASEQAASTEEISSTIEELTSSNHQNADNAKSTALLSQSVYTAMEELNRSSLKNLNSISDIINKIRVVNDISFQTNILSLNASVEAARAGEAGSGFLVIAHEIRSLADISKNAANEIHQLSGNTLKETSETVQNIGVYLDALKQTSDLISQISAVTEEQTIGTDQMNVAIQQLNQIAQQNSATSEELAASYEELNDQAKKLSKTMTFFKIN